ncbi:MAG TPA: enoyl-CoA hydratase-related protein [Candidatus Limnocylindria bacterium]|nr:enoyl-CoA hydratase-related protein [Candidatus Limnocylindria bacterium]
MSDVRLEIDGRRVARITIARPERKNAFDAALIADLTAIARRIDRNARAVVLAGDGDTFCAGADLTWMSSMVDFDKAANAADSRALAEMYAALDDLPMPLLARVQGAAIGGGAGLVAVADIAIASEDAFFAFTEVRLGILPAVVSPYVVRKIGHAHATALFTTGMRFDARRAREVGLVEDVAPPAELEARVASYVSGVLEGGPQAVNVAKRLVREVAGRPPSDVRDLTIERIAAARVSAEGQERMRKFLQRRKT